MTLSVRQCAQLVWGSAPVLLTCSCLHGHTHTNGVSAQYQRIYVYKTQKNVQNLYFK
uniref:Uncharacterized protein n=1 Tax=Anguilla anguilla TaxID=7936 RepID=A0A0E9T9U0_ANGAN